MSALRRPRCRFDGLSRVRPKTCEDAQKIDVPAHKRCRPHRVLRVVPVTPETAKSAVKEAAQVEREAKAEVKALREDLRDAEKLARQAEAQTRKVRVVRYQPFTPPAKRGTTSRATEDDEDEAPVKTKRVARDAAKMTMENKGEGYTPQMLKSLIGEYGAVTERNARTMVPLDPCTGQHFDEFRPEDDYDDRQAAWFRQVKKCAGVEGLGRLTHTRALNLKNKLIGRKTRATPPAIEDIDPRAWDVDPCDGMTYTRFRSGFTRKDAYWAAVRTDSEGRRHGPSKKRTSGSHAVLKRELWRERLHACAMRVWINRARVSKDARVRDAAARFHASESRYTPEDFMDGLGRTRPKGVKRCAKAPKKLTKGCSEDAYRANLRHLICVAKKDPQQAKAIAASVLKRGCGLQKTSARTIKGIVQAGKRKKRRSR